MTRIGLGPLMAVLVCLTSLGACSGGEEPAGPDDDVPVGLRVRLNGALVTRIDGTVVEGLLPVHVGEYSGQSSDRSFLPPPVRRPGTALIAHRSSART